MPIQLPNLDDRSYRQLVDEMLARVPVHTPEWTQFGEADPGVTLLELFAFLGENLLYRANQIPERNRLKFLQLTRPVLGERAGRFADAVLALDTFDRVGTVTELARP